MIFYYLLTVKGDNKIVYKMIFYYLLTEKGGNKIVYKNEDDILLFTNCKGK